MTFTPLNEVSKLVTLREIADSYEPVHEVPNLAEELAKKYPFPIPEVESDEVVFVELGRLKDSLYVGDSENDKSKPDEPFPTQKLNFSNHVNYEEGKIYEDLSNAWLQYKHDRYLLGAVVDKSAVSSLDQLTDESTSHGAMGEVVKAWDCKIGRWVALKIVRYHDEGALKDSSFASNAAEKATMFAELEAKNAIRLRSPYIAETYDSFMSDYEGQKCMVIAQEWIEGVTLYDELKETDRNMNLEDLSTVLRCVGFGLEEMHRKDFIHRDLKPGNIMLIKDTEGKIIGAKLVDFGFSSHVDDIYKSRMIDVGSFVGTPEYMPPEASTAFDKTSIKSDIHSLATVAYELFTGERPYESILKDSTPAFERVLLVVLRSNLEYEEITSDRLSSRGININLYELEQLNTILRKGLEKNPSERQDSVMDMVNDLLAFIDRVNATQTSQELSAHSASNQ